MHRSLERDLNDLFRDNRCDFCAIIRREEVSVKLNHLLVPFRDCRVLLSRESSHCTVRGPVSLTGLYFLL